MVTDLSSKAGMRIRYEFNAQYRDHPSSPQTRHLLAIFVTEDGFVGTPTYLLPLSSRGFSCNMCTAFHFYKNSGLDMVQYNDGVSGGGLNYGFANGVFTQMGTFTSMDVGSGIGTLTITPE